MHSLCRLDVLLPSGVHKQGQLGPGQPRTFLKQLAHQDQKLVVLVDQVDRPAAVEVPGVGGQAKLYQALREVVVLQEYAIVQNIAAVLLRDHFQVEEPRVVCADVQQVIKPFFLVFYYCQVVGAVSVLVVLVRVVSFQQYAVYLRGG